MHNYGPAYEGGGWAKTPAGNLKRATSIVDTVIRLTQPIFGKVWNEKHRMGTDKPGVIYDALPIVGADTMRQNLSPLIDAGRISDVEIEIEKTGKRLFATMEFLDERKQPHRLARFARVF